MNEECLQIGDKMIMRGKNKISNKAKEMQRKKGEGREGNNVSILI